MTDSTSSTPCTTSTSQNVYSTPSYGSGSSSWGGSGSPYDSCVQKCAASYGGLSMTYSAPPSTTTAAGSNSGGGMTHTVIVAPTQGILRYVPFVVNASVGDTVEFVWGANNHTVTKSSQLAVCNKTSAAPFASGEQNKTFTFSQMVNDTNATFFYCGTPGHCEKGMFGIINPPNAVPGSNTSVASMMSGMASNSSNVSSMNSYTNNMTSNNTVASNWGGNIDMSGMPEWSYQYIAENVMYTRTFLAANPQTLNADGTVSLGNAGNTPMVIPNDITSAANSGTPSSPGSSVPSAAPAASVSGNSPYGAGSTNGARRLGSSDVAIGFVVAASLALVF
ncbi:hypothetical protein BJ138DRAFT_996735 [Hygrophoropsis aurantiaca]|uniref:Uncharacterized protein n=1 Tax=Hygrophoropsis aurantiaca TaxID=72124 RepID=A0ACB8ARN0_9AGAM|nr:hypothetical protein BJ138DRAFT_996735 [Hygrophoropsis aurantiaca]